MIKDIERQTRRLILINYASEEGLAITPILVGSHGIGKSQIIHTIAEKINGTCYVVEGGSIKEGELTGLPYVEKDKNGKTFFSYVLHPGIERIEEINEMYYNKLKTTGFLEGKIKLTEKGLEIKTGSNPRIVPLKTEEELAYIGRRNVHNFGKDLTPEERFLLIKNKEIKPFILFIDELNRSDAQTMKELMNIILNKSVNGYDLPFFVQIISAVNPASANSSYATNEMDDAQLDRFLKLRVKPSFEEWLDYGMEKKMNPEFLSALSVSSDEIFINKNNEEDETEMKPSPRSWEMCHTIFSEAEKLNIPEFFSSEEREKLENDIMVLFNGKVGEASRTFFKNLRDTENFVKPSDIINGEGKTINKNVIEKLLKQKQIRLKVTSFSIINYLCLNYCTFEENAKKNAEEKKKLDNINAQIKQFTEIIDDVTRLIFLKKIAETDTVLTEDKKPLFVKIAKKCFSKEMLDERINFKSDIKEMLGKE